MLTHSAGYIQEGDRDIEKPPVRPPHLLLARVNRHHATVVCIQSSKQVSITSKNPDGVADYAHASAGWILSSIPLTSLDSQCTMKEESVLRAHDSKHRFRVRFSYRSFCVLTPRSRGLLFGPFSLFFSGLVSRMPVNAMHRSSI